MLILLLCHPQVRPLCSNTPGEMPEVIQTQGGNYLHDRIADVTLSLLSFPSGIKAHIFVSWLHPYKEQKLIVVGDRKMAGNTAKVALSAQVIGIQQFGDLPPSTYFACSYIASEGVSN